jgi:CubicO group peptidase (beta-lactamase class C family)
MPKYRGLSVVERVDLDSDEGARNTPFPIASISKSFCGAVCALMAVDDKFGKMGIDATLQEVLKYAKLQHPERAEKIDKYQQMLEVRGFSDVKISELLTHQSGCRDADEISPSTYAGRSPLEFFSDHLGREGCERGKYRYSNVGYTLLEEFVNLVSDKGSYKQELQERIFAKLALTNTGLLEDSLDPKSHEADLHLGRAVFIPGSKESPHSDKIIETHTEFPANHTTPLGAVHASCGGLYSSVNDLQKFSEELGKMVIGQGNSLTNNPKAVSELYRQQLRDSRHYSLGVEFVGIDEGKCAMQHTGLFPGNFASMAVLMPCSFDHLKSDAVIELGAGEKLQTNIVMQKFDYTVSTHFTEKAGAIPTAMLKEFVNSRLDDAERKRFSDASGDEIEKYLIEKERLPKDFAKTCEEILEAFKPAGDRVKKFLIENYLNEDGVIDGAKIAKDFKTTEDVDKKAIGPMFVEGREIATGILSKLSESLTQTESLTESMSKSTSAPAQTSFVERLGLQKPEKNHDHLSSVEAAQAGKYGNIGSKGGAREL